MILSLTRSCGKQSLGEQLIPLSLIMSSSSEIQVGLNSKGGVTVVSVQSGIEVAGMLSRIFLTFSEKNLLKSDASSSILSV